MGGTKSTGAGAAALALLCVGCYHGIENDAGAAEDGTADGADSASGETWNEDETGGGDETGSDDGEPGDAACSAEELGITPSLMRRLTAKQLEYTLQDLLGTTIADDEALEELAMLADGDAGGFAATTANPGNQDIRTFLSVAEELAERLVESDEPGCDVETRACAEAFAADLGRRAYRRPLEDAEHADLLTLYDAQASAYGGGVGFETMVAAILTSPNFLYLEEPATVADENLAPLGNYAVASRLSYFLWSSMPDDALLDSAATGELESADGVEAQALRMLDDPRFERTIRSFHRQWLPLDRLAEAERTDPAWSDALKVAMEEETLRFAESVYRDGGGLESLLTARHTFVDNTLAAFYGIDAPAEPFGRVELGDGPRAGILTHASFLAASDPLFPEVHRGLFVREHLLCDDAGMIPEVLPEQTGETRLEDPACVSCHIAMDSIGLGFSHFDSVGRHRTQLPDGTAIDNTGELWQTTRPLPDAIEGPFQGAAELAGKLASSPNFAWCVGAHWSRYATGRLDSEADTCALDAFSDRLIESEGDLQQLLVDIATSRWFRSREKSELGG